MRKKKLQQFGDNFKKSNFGWGNVLFHAKLLMIITSISNRVCFGEPNGGVILNTIKEHQKRQ